MARSAASKAILDCCFDLTSISTTAVAGRGRDDVLNRSVGDADVDAAAMTSVSPLLHVKMAWSGTSPARLNVCVFLGRSCTGDAASYGEVVHQHCLQ